jgi:hypothetical protein
MNYKDFIGGLVFGLICLIGGAGLSNLITITGWYNYWFISFFIGVYAITLAYKFNKLFSGYWTNTSWYNK